LVRTQFLEGQLPLFVPTTDWKCPTELPDLSQELEIALDSETRDYSLAANRGPGSYTKSGYIIGLSLAWSRGKIYVPIRHPDTANFDHNLVGLWLKDLFSLDTITWVLHHASYDLTWIRAEWGLLPPKNIQDTGAMAALIDENRLSYSLDNLCKWRGIQGKDESLLEEVGAVYGFARDIKANLWRLPAKYVGPYAEQDAESTLQLARSLRPEIENQELQEACRVEMGLIPLVLEMSWRGVRIDIDKAEQTRDRLIKKRDRELKELSDLLNHTVGMSEINSARMLEKFFLQLKIPFERTEKSKQAKLDSDWMEKHEHWLPQKITHIRQLDAGAEKFIQGFLLDFCHNSRIHATINQFRSDDGGTRSHRVSYSNPPLQQMPSRDSTPIKEELAIQIRGCFVPEPGETWGAHDLSQQEYRIIVHYSELMKSRKADHAGDRYRNEPKTDFHDYVAEITGLPRKRAKDVNFAKAYSAGVAKFALMTGMSFEEAKEAMDTYDEELPFVKESSTKCKTVAEQRGYIRLLDGARSHFDFWEPSYRKWEEEQTYRGDMGTAPCSLEEAQERVNDPNHPWKGRIVRAYTHRSFNRLVQGGAARQVKKAMLDCWNEGLIPLLQIHDELCFSHTSEEEGKKVNQIMRDAIKLTVPMRCDSEYGISWGTARVVKDKQKNIIYDASWQSAQRLKNSGKWW
jgi:DNA polymerase I-like protein with 3'-5' exonuclease and polymerase domains